MTTLPTRWRRIEHHAVLLPSGASLSFQRYLLEGSDAFETAPQSLGALPCAAAGEGVMVPLPEGEGVWIACLSAPGALRTSLSARPGTQSARATRVTLAAPAMLVTLPGLRRSTGDFAAIRRRSGERALRIAVRTAFARAEPEIETLAVTLVPPDQFEAATGRHVPAAEPQHAFGGWRLP